jgi:hypothetical protein
VKFLIDKSPKDVERKNESDLVLGQLLTPLTRYNNWGGPFAIDNGSFSNFDSGAFLALLSREEHRKIDCLFVAIPDIVGNARRTLELWEHRERWAESWPQAFVAQDGSEDLQIPWNDMEALFIGGMDPWKDSDPAADLVRTALTLQIHVHVGRVNTAERFKRFDRLGADTCDGSGVSQYDHMLQNIESSLEPEPTLFDFTGD